MIPAFRRALAMAFTGASLALAANFPDPAVLPVRQAWPDPLQLLDGSPVTSVAEWNARRKPELRELFQH